MWFWCLALLASFSPLGRKSWRKEELKKIPLCTICPSEIRLCIQHGSFFLSASWFCINSCLSPGMQSNLTAKPSFCLLCTHLTWKHFQSHPEETTLTVCLISGHRDDVMILLCGAVKYVHSSVCLTTWKPLPLRVGLKCYHAKRSELLSPFVRLACASSDAPERDLLCMPSTALWRSETDKRRTPSCGHASGLRMLCYQAGSLRLYLALFPLFNFVLAGYFICISIPRGYGCFVQWCHQRAISRQSISTALGAKV